MVFSKNAEILMAHSRRVFILLRDARGTLKLKKCVFFAEKISYLEHIIRPGRLELSKAIAAAVHEVKEPSTRTEVRFFTGLCNMFRQCFSNFSEVAVTLNKRLRKEQSITTFAVTKAEFVTVESLKTLPMKPSVLGLPHATGQNTITTDECNTHIRRILLQKQEDGTIRLIWYWSRTLTSA